MINETVFWKNILLLGIGTFGIRSFFVFFSHRITISARQKEILSFIPAAVLPALMTPMVFYHQGEVSWLVDKERLVIFFFALFIAYKFKNMLVTIAFGLTLLFLLKNFL